MGYREMERARWNEKKMVDNMRKRGLTMIWMDFDSLGKWVGSLYWSFKGKFHYERRKKDW